MKIFNWVHRRFNSRAAENGKNNVGIGGEDEKKGNVLEHWRDGILTIGTFGYDPLKDESCDDDQINYDHVCNEEEEEEEELAHVEHYHDDVDDDSEEDDEDDEEEEEKPNLIFAGCYEEEEEEEEEEKRSWELGYEYVMMEKKARTTLADLFLHAHEDTTATTTTTTFNHDQLSKKTKKKKHLLLDQLGPIHKLNKLMRRMLKKKIHPADIGAHNSKVTDINDHASLLIPTHHQDVII